MNCINNNPPKIATKKKCTACLSCVSTCPKGAIQPYTDNDGHVYVKIDKEKCIGCKKCEIVCKNSRNSFGNNNLYESNILPLGQKIKILERIQHLEEYLPL